MNYGIGPYEPTGEVRRGRTDPMIKKSLSMNRKANMRGKHTNYQNYMDKMDRALN